MICKINNVLATRLRVIYLDRRSYRAKLILSNLLSISIKTLFKDRSIIIYFEIKDY